MAWFQFPWMLNLSGMPSCSIGEWIQLILHADSTLHLPFEDFQPFILFFAILLDSLQFSKNQFVHHGIQAEPPMVIDKIRALYFKHSLAWNEVLRPTPPTLWRPPPDNVWKINFDVAVRNSYSFVAAVCRNIEGTILFAWIKSLPPSQPLVGKARATLFAVQEVCFLQFENIIFEGDSKTVIDALLDCGGPMD